MAWNARPVFTTSTSLLPKVRKVRPVLPRVENLEPRLVLTIRPEEQLFVYLLNQIRHDPQAYDAAANLGGILDGVEARQPLAVNDDLFASAAFHADEMAEFDYFAHRSVVTGDYPNKMARDAGYDLPDYFPNNANYIESLAAGTFYFDPADVIKALIVDAGVTDFGHRKHLLGIDEGNALANEIGVGHASNLLSTYAHYWAAHITFSDPDYVFLTGVAYEDINSDTVYGLNEGLGGVTVSIDGTNLTTVTNAQGGWSIRVPASGTYTVRIAGGDFQGTSTSIVQVSGLNREVDFTSGVTSGVIDFGGPGVGTNHPPVNTLPAGPIDVTEDVVVNLTGISVADSDVGNSSVRVTLDVTHGKLQIRTNVTNGVNSDQVTGNNSGHIVITAPLSRINTTLAALQGLSYRGTADFSGFDTLTIVTSDRQDDAVGGAQSDTDTLELVISAINDAPVNTVPTSPVSAITALSTQISGLRLSDSDLGTSDAVVTLNVTHGTLTIRTDVASGLTAGDIANNGTTTVTITAPLSRLLATYQATGGVMYLSDVGYIGTDTLTVTASDQGQTGSGGILTDEDTVGIQVLPPPIAPVITVPATVTGPTKGKPVIIGGGATLLDPDSPNFSNGKITVQITSGGTSNDKLTLTKVGTKPGQVNLSRDKVRLGRTVIGTLSGGTNGSPLVIRFNTNVSPATVQSVMQRVTLKAARRKLTPGTRTVEFTATDPTQLTSIPQSREVVVPA